MTTVSFNAFATTNGFANDLAMGDFELSIKEYGDYKKGTPVSKPTWGMNEAGRNNLIELISKILCVFPSDAKSNVTPVVFASERLTMTLPYKDLHSKISHVQDALAALKL